MGEEKQSGAKAPVKRRPGPTIAGIRKALELVFIGQGGVLLSVRAAAKKAEPASRTCLQRTVGVIADELRRKRFAGYSKQEGARRTNYPVPAEGSNLRKYLQQRTSTYEPPPQRGPVPNVLDAR